MKKLFFIAAFLLFQLKFTVLYSQSIEASFSRGPVLEIYPEFPKSTGANRTALIFNTKNDPNNIWNKAHNQPFTGLKISFMNLGSEILGNAYGIQYQFIKHLSISQKLNFNYGVALGGILFDNPYDYEDNQLNIASGSTFSFLPEIILGVDYQLLTRWSTGIYFDLYHSSNGHAQLPNVGINVPSYQLNVKYRFNENEKISNVINSEEWKKQWHMNGRFSLGVNEYGRSTAPTNGPKNLIYLTSFYASKRYSPKGFFQIGMDAYYNTGYRNYIISQNIDQVSDLEDKFTDASALLLFIGHEYIYGHFGMLIQAGYNLHNPFLTYYINKDESAETWSLKAKIPGKFGVQYYLGNPFNYTKSNLTLGVYIKSNISQADFLEIGLGWRI